MKKSYMYITLFFTVLLLDRITKYVALHNLATPYQLTPFLSFDMVINRGISWGMFHANSTILFYLITLIIIGIIALLIWHTMQRVKQRKIIVGEVLVIAGAVSNIIDRFQYHGVLDFILFSYGGWSFPVFNVADMAIFIGVVIMLITYWRE